MVAYLIEERDVIGVGNYVQDNLRCERDDWEHDASELDVHVICGVDGPQGEDDSDSGRYGDLGEWWSSVG